MMAEQHIFKTGDLVATEAPNGHYLAVVGSPSFTPRSKQLLVHIVGSSHGGPQQRPVRRDPKGVRWLRSTWKQQTGRDFKPRRDGQGVMPDGDMDPKRIRHLKRLAGLVR